MPLEEITVIAGGSSLGSGYGATYGEWETVVVEADIAVGYINALLTTSEVTPIGASTTTAFDKWAFPPGTPIEIYANGDLVCNTIVWQYVPTADASSHSITLYCKSHSLYFDVSSILSETGGTYEDTSVKKLIGEWAQQNGVRTVGVGKDDYVGLWQIRQGATGFEEAVRMAKQHGQMIFGMMDGSLAISDGTAMGAQGPIVQGENILTMTARLTDMQFENNLTIGQKNIGTDLKEAIQSMGEAGTKTPGSALGKRLKTIVEPAQVTNMAAANRSDWERRRSYGATTEAVVKVPGWHAPAGLNYVQKNYVIGQTPPSAGPLWMLMADTYLFAPWLKINCTMRAIRVVFKQSLAEGSTTELTLQDPVAFLGTQGAPCENGVVYKPGWSLGTGEYQKGFEIERFNEYMRYFGQGVGMGQE